MKITKVFTLFAVAALSIACSRETKETFVSDFSTYPLCTDARDSSVVFVEVKNGDKVSKKYLEAYAFFNDYAVVRTSEGWTFVDKNFKQPINDYYLDATHFSEGIAYVVKPEQHIQAIDEDGKTLHLLQNADAVYAISEGRSVYKGKNNLYGILDKNGEIVLSAKYDGAEKFVKDGTLIVMSKDERGNSKWGILDANGETLIPVNYAKIVRYDNGFTIYKSNKKAAWYDLRSNVVSEFMYYDVIKDGKTLCHRTKKGKYGWLNLKGKDIIEPRFDDVTLFDGRDYAFAKDSRRGREWGIIDKKGEWVIKPRYGTVTVTDSYPIISNDRGEYGVIDYDGNVLIKANKSKISHIYDDYYLITNYENEIGIMKADGKEEWIARPSYEHFKGVRYRPSTMVSTDYVDIHSISKTISKDIQGLQKTSINGLLSAYNISKESLPRKTANVTLKEHKTRDYTITLAAERVTAWTTTYDWWEGDITSFNGKSTIKRYVVTVSLKQKYAAHKADIMRQLQKDLGLDETLSAKRDGKTFKLTDFTTKYQSGLKVSIVLD